MNAFQEKIAASIGAQCTDSRENFPVSFCVDEMLQSNAADANPKSQIGWVEFGCAVTNWCARNGYHISKIESGKQVTTMLSGWWFTYHFTKNPNA